MGGAWQPVSLHGRGVALGRVGGAVLQAGEVGEVGGHARLQQRLRAHGAQRQARQQAHTRLEHVQRTQVVGVPRQERHELGVVGRQSAGGWKVTIT